MKYFLLLQLLTLGEPICYGQHVPICQLGQKPVCVCTGDIGQNCGYVCM